MINFDCVTKENKKEHITQIERNSLIIHIEY